MHEWDVIKESVTTLNLNSMATEKKSFLLHIDSLTVLDELTDAQAGKLFKTIKAYHLRDAERSKQDGDAGFDRLMEEFFIRIAFAPFRAQFERDEVSYKEMIEKRREAGKKGGAPKGNDNASKEAKQTNASETNKSLTEQPKQASALDNNQNKQNKQELQKQAKQADSVSDSVSVSDKENINTDSYSKNLPENKFSATESAHESKNETLASEQKTEKPKTENPVTPPEVVTDPPNPIPKENPIIPPVVENPNSGDLSGGNGESGMIIPPKGEELPKPPKKRDKVNFSAVVNLYHSICTNYPQVFRLSDARKDKISIRMEEFSKDGLDGLEVVKTIFEKMQESKFLRGDNKRGWKASFDWIFENQKNWVKIIEGTYDNKTQVNDNGGTKAEPNIPKATSELQRDYNESF